MSNSIPMETEEVIGAGDVNGNIIGSASSPPPSPDELIISEEDLELTSGEVRSSIDSISQPSGSPACISKEWKPLSPRLYEGDDLRSLNMIQTVHRDTESVEQMVYNLLTGVPLRKKLTTPVEEEAKIRKSIVEAYQAIMKRREVTVSWLNGIWSRIKILEEDMQASQDKPLSPCGNYHEIIGSLKIEFQSLLSFAAPNLHGTRELYALMREVVKGRDLKRAGVLNPYGSNLPEVEVMHRDKVWGIETNIVETEEADFRGILSRSTEVHHYPSSHGWWQGQPSMPSKEIWSLKDRISETKIRYCQMNGGEIGEVRDIWHNIMTLREACFYRKYNLNVEFLISKFNSLLRFFLSNEMLPKESSDFRFKEDCRQLLRQVNDYTDLEGAWTSADSVGQTSSNGGKSTLGDPSHPTVRGNCMSEQVVKLKSFDKFAQWATALFLASLIGLTAVNVKQAQFLFRSCSSLVFAATISGIGMLMLVLMGNSSARVLSSLKILQYLIVGLLFITATQVYMFTLR